MDVVLELAHLVEDGDDYKIPLKERLVEKIVFNINDIVMITALNVDLDYASKGSVHSKTCMVEKVYHQSNTSDGRGLSRVH